MASPQVAQAAWRLLLVQTINRRMAAKRSLADPAAAASVAPSSHAAAGIDVPVAAWDSASVSTAKSLGRGL
mgnify:FL=1